MAFLYGIVYGRSSVFRKVVKSVGTGTLAGTHVHYPAWLCIDVTSAYKCKIALTDQKVYYLYVSVGLEHVIPIGLNAGFYTLK